MTLLDKVPRVFWLKHILSFVLVYKVVISMANTRDQIGDQETLDGLINGTLEHFEDDMNIVLRPYSFYKNKGIKTIKFTNLQGINTSSIRNCSNLENIELKYSENSTIVIYSCPKLKFLTLSNTDSVKILYDSIAIMPCEITKFNGAIFVPSNLLNSYKTSVNYLPYRYLIFPIGSSPETNHYATITDSWTNILAACNDGTYVSKYNIGDTAVVLIDGNYYLFEIVAKCNDINTATADTAEPLSSDNTKFAHLTWLLTNYYSTAMSYSNTNAGGWDSSVMKNWLNNTVFTLLPQELQNGILAVDKTCQQGSADSGATTTSTNNKLWLPSAREIFGGSDYESSGLVYTTQFSTASARIKFNSNGSASGWWTRSANSTNSSYFRFVCHDGSVSGNNAYSSYGVVFGFCT